MVKRIEVNFINVFNKVHYNFSYLDRGRDITKGGKGGKNEKQKLDQQFQKIQNIMKKRDETRKAGGDYHKVNY